MHIYSTIMMEKEGSHFYVSVTDKGIKITRADATERWDDEDFPEVQWTWDAIKMATERRKYGLCDVENSRGGTRHDKGSGEE